MGEQDTVAVRVARRSADADGGAAAASADAPEGLEPDRRRAVTVSVALGSDAGGVTPPDGAPAPARSGRAPETLGRYRIVRELGRGGVGVVYEAIDTQLERPVALKTLLAGAAAGDAQLERFRREVRASSHLRHPHIVAVHDAGSSDGHFFLAMDLIDGESLDQLVERERRLPPRRALELLLPVARALDYAHGEGIVHRDVKPENILLDSRGEPYLTDFGLARDLSDSQRLTRDGHTVGTPVFMSPEQLRGQPVGPAADVYALGVTLFECLTGEVPFAGDSLAALMDRILAQEPPPLRQLVPDLAADAEAIVLKCLEKEPERRYGSAALLADDIERFLRGEATRARPPSGIRRVLRRLRRHRPVLLGAALAAVGLFGGATYAARVHDEADEAQRMRAALERERTRLLEAHAAAGRRQQRDEARRAAMAEAALALTTEARIRAYDHLLSSFPDAWEGRIERARLKRNLAHELRARSRDLPGAEGALREALEDLRVAAQGATDRVPILLLQAELLRTDLKRPAEAVEVYGELLHCGNPALASYAQARLLQARGEMGPALEAVGSVIEERPNLTPARLLRCELLLRTGQLEEALEQLDQLAGDSANGAEVVRLRGEVLFTLGATIEAHREAVRAVELDPTSAASFLLLGRIRLYGGETARAIAAFQAAAELAPEDPQPLLLMAQARLTWGDARGADALLKRASHLRKPAPAQAADPR